MECLTIKALAPIFPGLRRTGSMAYKKAAADLTSGPGSRGLEMAPPLLMVVTKDKGNGNPLLVTMSVEDLKRFLETPGNLPVRVQCKGRASTWIGKLWRELREAVKTEKGAGEG